MKIAHFPIYAEELREFSASHGLPYGTPEDLRGLVGALDAGGTFFEEWSSMLRSVLYREGGEADANSLLMLVTGVWGGMAEPGAEMVPPLRRFVRGAMRAPQFEELDPVAGDVHWAESGLEHVPGAEVSGSEQAVPVTQQAISAMEVESALRELETGSAEVRLYRELLDQREAALAAEMTSSEGAGVELASAGAAAESRSAFANGFDPWDESSELQQELRRFAEHREQMLALEAERASRPLHAKLLGGAESALVQLLGRDKPLRRGLGLRSH